MNNLNSKTTTYVKTTMTMSWATSAPWQRHLLKLLWRCHEQPQLHDNDLYENHYDDVMNNLNSMTTTFMKTNTTMSWTTSTPWQRPLLEPLWRCHEQPQLHNDGLCKNHYDDVMNNLNSKTTTLMKTNTTMSLATSSPRQRPLWKRIRRCHEQLQLQDNGLCENQYYNDDVMINLNSKTTTYYMKTNMTM